MLPSGAGEPAGATGYQNSYQPQGFAIVSHPLPFPPGCPGSGCPTTPAAPLPLMPACPGVPAAAPVLPYLRLRAILRVSLVPSCLERATDVVWQAVNNGAAAPDLPLSPFDDKPRRHPIFCPFYAPLAKPQGQPAPQRGSPTVSSGRPCYPGVASLPALTGGGWVFVRVFLSDNHNTLPSPRRAPK